MMDNKKLQELDKKCDELRQRLSELESEKRELYVKEYVKKIDKNKFYRIYDDVWSIDTESHIVGMITNFWYSRQEEKYIVNICGLRQSFNGDYADECYSQFDAMIQIDIPIDKMDYFVDKLEEVDEEQFNSYVNVWFEKTKGFINEWFTHFKNKNYEEDEE